MNRYMFFIATLLLVAVGTQQASAAEAVGMEILQDGKSVAGFTITYSGETEAEIWLMLKDVRLTFERDFPIPVDADDPMKATLTGAIEVRTRRRGDPGTSMVTDHVDLVRRGPTDWYLAESEVDRTLRATGLPLPTKKRPTARDSMGLYWLIPFSLLVLVITVVLFLITRRGSTAR